MKKKISTFLALVMIIGTVCGNIMTYGAERQLPSGKSYSEIGSEIENFVSEHRDTTAGMAVSVFDNDTEIFKNYYGYADIENQIAVNEETVFEWGSVSKLIVWVSVMQLYEQGKIDLNTDIRTYLPDNFLTKLRYDTPITMLNLMNHNAGFQEVYVDLFVKEENSLTSLGEALSATEPEQIYEPGFATGYSNWGVALAAYIVEQISGVDFCEYVHKNIFEPLNMEHTAFAADLSDNDWVKEKRKELQCYTIDAKLIPNCFYYLTLYPAGLCTSTLEDFKLFAAALLDENTVLFQKSDTWKELFTPTDYYGSTDIPLNYHGFWVCPFAVKTVGHGGNTAGCSSYLLLQLDSKIGAVVMTNQSSEECYNVDMMELIFGKYEELNYFDEKRQAPSGVFSSARTVKKGPLKCIALSFYKEENEGDELWVYDDSVTPRKLSYSYMDLLEIPLFTLVWELGIVGCLALVIVISIITLLVKFITFIVRKIGKKEKKGNLFGTLVCLAHVAFFALFMGVLFNVMNYSTGASYVWIFVAIALLALIMIFMICFGIVKLIKNKNMTKGKIFNVFSILSLIITVVNIAYWNLFMFWML